MPAGSGLLEQELREYHSRADETGTCGVHRGPRTDSDRRLRHTLRRTREQAQLTKTTDRQQCEYEVQYSGVAYVG